MEYFQYSDDVFAVDRALVEILQVNPKRVPTVFMSQKLGYCPDLKDIEFPLETPESLQVENWKLPEKMMAIDFGAPRVLRSTFKHFYIRWIREPLAAYANR